MNQESAAKSAMMTPPPGRWGERAVALLGGALLLAAVFMDRSWFARHFLPSILIPRQTMLLLLALWRGYAAVSGVALLLLRRPLGRRLGPWLRRRGLLLFVCLLALLGAGEFGLRHIEQRTERAPQSSRYIEVSLGERHPRYGWLWRPQEAQWMTWTGRAVEYAINRERCRAERTDSAIDFARPSVLLTGESIAVGHGLHYRESLPALLAAALGLQAVNLAVNGYGSDQAYLRLLDELPRFSHPQVVVTLFVPDQLPRNLRKERPHLVLAAADSLVLAPPQTGLWAGLRLRRLLASVSPYMSDADLRRALAVTRAILRDTAARVRARGGRPLFVVPSFGPPRPLAAHPEAELLQALFTPAGLSYVLVDIDPRFKVRDGHPDARAARLLADAITAALRGP